MSKVIDYLKENKVIQFSTIRDNQVHMRPFTFIMEKEGKLIFYTDNTKEVFKELKENPTAGFSVMGQDIQWVRARGKVAFSDSLELKAEVFEAYPLLEKMYTTSDNPIFEIFCLYDGVASLHNYTGTLIEEMTL